MKKAFALVALVAVVILTTLGTVKLMNWNKERQLQKIQNMSFLFGVFDSVVDSALDDRMLNMAEYRTGQEVGKQLIQERRPVGQPMTLENYLALLSGTDEKELLAMRTAHAGVR